MINNIFGIVGAIGVIFTVYVYFYNKAKPCYTKRTQCLIRNRKDKYNKIDVTYDGQSIDKVSITTLAIWNTGNKDFEFEKYCSKKDIPKIVTKDKDIKILDYKMLECYDDAFIDVKNKFNDESNNIEFDFKSIPKGQGFIFKIFHTGLNNDSIDLQLKKKNCKIKSKYLFIQESKYDSKKKACFKILLLFLGVFFLSVTIPIGFKNIKKEFTMDKLGLLISIIFILIVLIFYIYYIVIRTWLYNRGMPKQFIKYFGDE